MDDWKVAVDKFLEQYIKEDYFLGAILTGSYATDNQDENSDIDIYILTADDTKWRERGNKNVNGFLIEYFINPKRQVLSYLESELENYHLSTTMMLVNGKILCDKDGSINELIHIAKNNFNLREVDKVKYKMNCYNVWDGFDELEAKYHKREDIEFAYNIFLQRVIEAYFYNRQIPSIPLNKIEKILRDEAYRKKYNIQKLPEQDFIIRLLNCFDEKDYDKKFDNAKELYQYFEDAFNDFDIDDFVVRSNID